MPCVSRQIVFPLDYTLNLTIPSLFQPDMVKLVQGKRYETTDLFDPSEFIRWKYDDESCDRSQFCLVLLEMYMSCAIAHLTKSFRRYLFSSIESPNELSLPWAVFTSRLHLRYSFDLRLLLLVWKLFRKCRYLSSKSQETFASTCSMDLRVRMCDASPVYFNSYIQVCFTLAEAQLLAGNDGNFHAFPVST